MGINRIFKHEARRQIKEGVKRKAKGLKVGPLPFTLKADASKHVHPRRFRVA